MDDQRPSPEAPGAPEEHGTPFVPLRLVLKPGGLSVELTGPDMLVGRHSDADIRLSLPDVSRRHCRFMFASQRWQVIDLNSLNGVFVNGDQVQQATLDPGDLVQIGGLTFEVEIGDAPRQTAPARPDILRSIADALPLPGQGAALPKRKAS